MGRGGRLPTDAAGWTSFFARFEEVVIVANSDDVDVARLRERFGEARTLFLFFNKTYKVLFGPFDGASLLVARSGPAGANVVYRGEVETVLRPFVGEAFEGVLNLRVGPKERFSDPNDFDGAAIGFLDLAPSFADFYPAGRVATSGFALAVWLAEQRNGARLHLAGFSARRSDRWKLFRDHDWTFEQTVLRLLHRAGCLELVDASVPPSSFAPVLRRFPEILPTEVVSTSLEILTERLGNTDAAVDQLFSVTRWQARIDRALRSLKPRTRKRKLAEARGGQADALAKTTGGD